ncbi:MAG: ADP-ribosylglycohydrolase family protein [archaeon]
MEKEALEGKVSGAIFGLAIGDALGFPIEFTRKTLWKDETDTKEMDLERKPIAIYSDDTQMSIAVANALISTPKPYELEATMANVRGEFVRWLKSPDNNRAPGMTCLEGTKNLERGIEWKKSWVISRGCGTAMRTAPIGVLFYNNPQKLIEIASATSVCTHAHPTAVASGIATAYLTALALKGEDPNTYIQRVVEIAKSQFGKDSKEFVGKIKQVDEVLKIKDKYKALTTLGEGWTGHEAVAIALYSFLRNPRDFKKTLVTSVNHNGDSDSTGCIAGAISGAYNGVDSIPKRWIASIENKNGLEKISKDLTKLTLEYNQNIQSTP